MVPDAANIHWLLLIPSHEKQIAMPADEAKDPNRPASGWLRLGLGSSKPETSQRGSLELDLFAPGVPAAPAMELFPTYPTAECPPSTYRPRQAAFPPMCPARLMPVAPPVRPTVGFWFALRAAQNQGKEPFLPQLRKSYLRIKDGRMTVRLLMKYLVNKLGLQHESEVEITCRGQQLPPFHTMQYVRDFIWCSRDLVALIPNSPSESVMTLQYGRT